MTDSINNLTKLIVSVAEERQAENIVVIDLNNSILVDSLVLLTAKNTTHIKALAEYLSQEAKKALKEIASDDFYEFPKLVGKAESGWLVLDLNAVAVHILLEDQRSHFDLDGLFEKRGTAYHY